MFRIPSIKSLLILLMGLSVFFWIIFSLIFLDHMNRLRIHDETRKNISKVRNQISLLRQEIDQLADQFNSFAPGTTVDISNDRIEEISISLNASLKDLESASFLKEDPVLLRTIKDASENIETIKNLTAKLVSLTYERGDLGTGLLNQWFTRLNSLKAMSDRSLPSRGKEFINQIYHFSLSFLLTHDPAELEKLADLWQLERNNAIPGNEGNTGNDNLPDEFYRNTESLIAVYRNAGATDANGVRAEIKLYITQTAEAISNLEKESAISFKKVASRIGISFVFIVFFSGLLSIYLFYLALNNASQAITLIRNFVKELKSGKIPETLEISFTDELTEIGNNLNSLASGLEQKVNFADHIGDFSSQIEYKPDGKDDVLGNSLIKMAERIREAAQEEKVHKQEEQKRRWLSEGMAGFGEIFRSERENLEELAFKVIKNLVTYIEANQGALYLNNTEESPPVIDLVAAFAYDRRKYLNRRIIYGEGLIGTCALEKETIFLTEIPAGYLEITSGLGQSLPRCLLIVPLKLENELFGILELASFKILESHEIGFVQQLGESIATTLAAVKINERTANLLEKSQKQAEEMARQEEKMKRNMQELQNTQEESRRKETEITGILNAVNSSSLVAEFSINGRFSDINESFLFLLESPREQVIGKHHSDFAVVDKYSQEYKDFWKRLKEGETIAQTEHFKLFNGNEIWLNQTFTPILDKNGKPYKILNIAHDFTQTRQQQESLLNQANEITRRNLEIETLSAAVDSAIIKCELSNDAVIMDANDNYLEATGYSRRELLGKNLRLFLKESEKQQFEKIWAEVNKEKTYTGVIRRTKPTGEEVWLMATFSPVRDEEGEIYKTYFLAQDVTEKKLKYQLLEDANQEIERLRAKINDLQNP